MPDESLARPKSTWSSGARARIPCWRSWPCWPRTRASLRLTEGAPSRQEPWSRIQGISFRALDGEVVHTPDRPLRKDLDSLPFPAHSPARHRAVHQPAAADRRAGPAGARLHHCHLAGLPLPVHLLLQGHHRADLAAALAGERRRRVALAGARPARHRDRRHGRLDDYQPGSGQDDLPPADRRGPE